MERSRGKRRGRREMGRNREKRRRGRRMKLAFHALYILVFETRKYGLSRGCFPCCTKLESEPNHPPPIDFLLGIWSQQ